MEYYRIKSIKKENQRLRCVELLKKLRTGLDAKIPERRLNESLIFGTWNIREFDSNSKKFGPRKQDDLFYIAEIVSRFDVLAVQEINEDIYKLKQVMWILGENYKYILTDVAAWKSGGNNERLGFIYDKRTIQFKGIAGELVLPQNMLIRNNNGIIERQFARTPFKCSFQSGWFKFKVTTVHIYFGEESEKSGGFKRRIDEIDKVAKIISDNAKKEAETSSRNSFVNPYNYFIVGDFNIVDENNVTYDALAKHGFETVKNRKGSNRDRTKFFDQISYYKTSDLDFEWEESHKEVGKDKNNSDRVFNFFKYIYTEEQFPLFKDDIIKYVSKNTSIFTKQITKLTSKIATLETKLLDNSITPRRRKVLENQKEKASVSLNYNQGLIALQNEDLKRFYITSPWNTFQVSDHLPLWMEIKIDKSDAYLESLTS